MAAWRREVGVTRLCWTFSFLAGVLSLLGRLLAAMEIGQPADGCRKLTAK